jgi:hypothetical protein
MGWQIGRKTCKMLKFD